MAARTWGQTKEDAIVIDEADEGAHQPKQRVKPPAWSLTPKRAVVDLTLSEDHVPIMQTPSVARSALDNRRKSHHRNADDGPNGFSPRNNEPVLMERVIPRTHPSRTTPHFATNRDGAISNK